jgi:(2R)-sulfolactate sulfo-lyase subunit alpha
MAEQVDFLAHHEGDAVAPAVHDVEAGAATLAYLDTGRRTQIQVSERIPLGHKVALADVAEAAAVTEYNVTIGLARQGIRAGELVHTHNLRSARW